MSHSSPRTSPSCQAALNELSPSLALLNTFTSSKLQLKELPPTYCPVLLCQGCLLIVRLTYQPEMVAPRCLSTVFILTLSNPVLVNKTVINRVISSTWLIVGKLGQGMRCCKCNSNANVLVCETQGKVCICMGESVSE